eukprot:augustus_masked-scaffold_7-processed-gene-6.44-mRNA-1 protein AED:1.00 eAED:1.00 QI:0/-1/0/0/-1/1/1/0/638
MIGNKKITIVGCGFSGLSNAILLANKGYEVTVLEQLAGPGGRNRVWKKDGFTFEIGPSWVWMKEVHAQVYSSVGKNVTDYVKFKRLDPAYRMVFNDKAVNVPDGKENFVNLIAKLEAEKISQDSKEAYSKLFEESKLKILSFLDEDKRRYEVAMKEYICKPSLDIAEYFSFAVASSFASMGLLQSQHTRVSRTFQSEKVRTLLEWPVIFVGGSPKMIPELYSILNYTAIEDGTLIPENGMSSLTDGMFKLAKELGVKFIFNAEVVGLGYVDNVTSAPKKINTTYYINHARERALSFASENPSLEQRTAGSSITESSSLSEEPSLETLLRPETESMNATLHRIKSSSKVITQVEPVETEHLVVSGDMHNFEMNILAPKERMYDEKYWDSRILSPSCLLFFVGLKKKIGECPHHMLFFDSDLYDHLESIYSPVSFSRNRLSGRKPVKPFEEVENPLFYVSIASKSHESYAPDGCESLFFLVPIPHHKLTRETKEAVFQNIFSRFAKEVGLASYDKEKEEEFFQFKKAYGYENFVSDYNSFKGNAFGLSNTLLQTAFMKPRMKSNKVINLFYVGQSVAPGGGIPPCIISGKIGANLVIEQDEHEKQPKEWFWKRIPKGLYSRVTQLTTTLLQKHSFNNIEF